MTSAQKTSARSTGAARKTARKAAEKTAGKKFDGFTAEEREAMRELPRS